MGYYTLGTYVAHKLEQVHCPTHSSFSRSWSNTLT
jgi:hypothetical protein